MSFFRSQSMGYYSLVIPRESAWDVINAIGDLNCLHFIDHDPNLPMINRPFANYIKRCDEVQNKIEQIESKLILFNKQIIYCDDTQELLRYYQRTLLNRNLANHTYFEEIEQKVGKKIIELNQQIVVLNNMMTERNTLIERKSVLIIANKLLGESYFQKNAFGGDELKSSMPDGLKFNQLVGVVGKEEEQRFKRTIFRVTKGNVWVNVVDISQANNQDILVDSENKEIMKSVFLIVFQGNDTTALAMKDKLQRVISAFNATLYDFPQSQKQYELDLQEIDRLMNEKKDLIGLTREQIEFYLESYSSIQPESKCSLVLELKLYVLREKYLYNTLNLMRMQGSIFCGNFWMPENSMQMVEQAIRRVQKQDNMPTGQIQVRDPPDDQTPPTYFRLNDVNWVFQEIVNTYGIPRYQEINPGLFTMVTFPFLFAVMYGDIGHGGLLLCLGLYLIFFKDFIIRSNSLFKPLLIARHMVLMMGLFAFYIGWIYNDFLSLSINVFGSCYDIVGDAWEKKYDNCTYMFGLDPAWRVAANELNFVNSYKMKLAVIIGVVHMTFGITLKGVNAVYLKLPLDFFCEFLPQIIFMICTFGYMDFLIIFKFLNVYEPELAPSIISTLIGMALTPLEIPPYPLWGDGVSQRNLSIFLLLTAIMCVPLMLLPKPFILDSLYQKEAQQLHSKQASPLEQGLIQGAEEHSEGKSQDSQFGKDLQQAANQNDNVENEDVKKPKQHKSIVDNNHGFSELFVHQVIETIEFVLGSISNTASYLRLWALSLAHGQLAEVFYDMTLASGIEHGGVEGIIYVIIGFVLFAVITFGVLMLMDVMECFLHALRLHWVEFQNKFYKADGYMFEPFSYLLFLKPHNQNPQ